VCEVRGAFQNGSDRRIKARLGLGLTECYYCLIHYGFASFTSIVPAQSVMHTLPNRRPGYGKHGGVRLDIRLDCRDVDFD
jgi:hypothetical protein